MNLKNKSNKELGVLLEKTKYSIAHLKQDKYDIEKEIIRRVDNEK